jgi:hypothetical protein
MHDVDIEEYRKSLQEKTMVVPRTKIYKGRKFVYNKVVRAFSDEDIERIIKIQISVYEHKFIYG